MEINCLYTIPKDIIGPTLLELAKENEKIVVMSSDVSVSCNIEMFHEQYPDRFFEMGIAEQSTMSVSGGLAAEGFIPVYVALAIFSNGMTWAQTRQICNSNLNVKVIGTHAGVDDGQDGSGHHATEDIAISRVLPRMTVLAPSDENDVKAAMKAMIEYQGPVYMRVAREEQPLIHSKECRFVIGKTEYLKDEGDDFAIVFEGTALKQALDGWKKLKEAGKYGKLISIRTIKPIDSKCINELADKVEMIITVENHSIIGGLYSTVCEALGKRKHKAIIKAVGFRDEFMMSGSSKDIKEKYNVSGQKVFEVFFEENSLEGKIE